MATVMTIGVTGPVGKIPWAWWATRWHLKRHKVRPVRLNPHVNIAERHFDGLIIGGGNDIDPAIYGGDVSSSPNIDPERDEYELSVLKEADDRGLPVLGICRGAQLINVHHGGSLFGDIANRRVFTSNKATLRPRKGIDIDPGSRLCQWMGGTRSRVNSLHHQAVKETGKNLTISAKDRDGIVQAIESTTGPTRLGVQWHPEYLPQQQQQRRLFKSFVEHCKNFHLRAA